MSEGWLVRVVISSRKIAKCCGLLCCTSSWLLGPLQKDIALYSTLSLIENEQRVLVFILQVRFTCRCSITTGERCSSLGLPSPPSKRSHRWYILYIVTYALGCLSISFSTMSGRFPDSNQFERERIIHLLPIRYAISLAILCECHPPLSHSIKEALNFSRLERSS